MSPSTRKPQCWLKEDKPMKMTAALLFIIAIGFFSIARSGEVSTPNLKLKATYFKTSDVPLTITPTPADAVSPTTVSCPRPAPCVLGIELSSQFNGLTPPNPNVVAAIVLVDGSIDTILPHAVLGLSSTSTGGGSDARGYIWTTKALPSGPHAVQVLLSVPEGSAGSFSRSLKIDVYEANKADNSR
jgi:hypothetical protein